MNVQKLSDDACLVDLPTELTDPDEQPLLNACAPSDRGQMLHIILDFGPVEHFNGLGASMLVKLDALARNRGQLLTGCRVNDQYHDVLSITGLRRRIKAHPRIEDALSALDIEANDEIQISPLASSSGDSSNWASPVAKLKAPPFPPEAWNRNVNGRRAVGPVNGFGQLWQKLYRLRVSDPSITPEQAILVMKENFPSLQPEFNRFYPSAAGIQPGEIVAIDSSTPGGPVSTGVVVLYADNFSFTFITPQGHPESGWVTFSSYRSEDHTIVQILGLARANDPVYELAFRAVGSKMQIKIWAHVLTSLASHLRVHPDISVEPTCVDRRMQWSKAKNVWYNAQIRTLLYMPMRGLGWPQRRRRRRAYA